MLQPKTHDSVKEVTDPKFYVVMIVQRHCFLRID